MTSQTAYHQLGRLIVQFQQLEATLTEILVLMSNADSEYVKILTNELGFSQRVNTTDVLFSRFVDLLNLEDFESKQREKKSFHKLMTELIELGKRRNELVHSKYIGWRNVEGIEGLLKKNSKLKPSDGTRESKEEKLLASSFEPDFENLSKASRSLERHRLTIISWRYPE